VQLYNDPETHQNILLILNLQEVEHHGQQRLDVPLEVIVGRETVDQLKNKLAQLLCVAVGCKLGLSVFEQL